MRMLAAREALAESLGFEPSLPVEVYELRRAVRACPSDGEASQMVGAPAQAREPRIEGAPLSRWRHPALRPRRCRDSVRQRRACHQQRMGEANARVPDQGLRRPGAATAGRDADVGGAWGIECSGTWKVRARVKGVPTGMPPILGAGSLGTRWIAASGPLCARGLSGPGLPTWRVRTRCGSIREKKCLPLLLRSLGS